MKATNEPGEFLSDLTEAAREIALGWLDNGARIGTDQKTGKPALILGTGEDERVLIKKGNQVLPRE